MNSVTILSNINHLGLGALVLICLTACASKPEIATHQETTAVINASGELVQEHHQTGPENAVRGCITLNYYGVFEQAGTGTVFEMCRDPRRTFLKFRINRDEIHHRFGNFDWARFSSEQALKRTHNTCVRRCPF